MKKFDFYKFAFILSCAGFCLPWFSYNPKMCGYDWGAEFIIFFAPMLLILGTYIFYGFDALWLKIMAELAALLNIPVALILWGRWENIANINDGWSFSLRAAQPGYWVALGLFAVLFAAVQVKMFKGSGSPAADEQTAMGQA